MNWCTYSLDAKGRTVEITILLESLARFQSLELSLNVWPAYPPVVLWKLKIDRSAAAYERGEIYCRKTGSSAWHHTLTWRKTGKKLSINAIGLVAKRMLGNRNWKSFWRFTIIYRIASRKSPEYLFYEIWMLHLYKKSFKVIIGWREKKSYFSQESIASTVKNETYIICKLDAIFFRVKNIASGFKFRTVKFQNSWHFEFKINECLNVERPNLRKSVK